MKILFGDLLPGETPIGDVSGLRIPGITNRRDLNQAEAESIRKVLRKYFGVDALTRDIAPMDFEWAMGLHREMFGEV